MSEAHEDAIKGNKNPDASGQKEKPPENGVADGARQVSAGCGNSPRALE
jgi:hypothetical protein